MSSFHGVIILVTAAILTGLCAAAEDPEVNKLPDKAKSILDKTEQFDLLSLDPDSDGGRAKDGFHGWKVLGKTVVKDPQTRKQILASLYKGISESVGGGAKCFDPRHGIRASVDGKTIDLVSVSNAVGFTSTSTRRRSVKGLPSRRESRKQPLTRS